MNGLSETAAIITILAVKIGLTMLCLHSIGLDANVAAGATGLLVMWKGK